MVSPELLAACRRGDRAAFEEVVRRTHRQVYTQALRIVGDRHEAEDVAQEAYLRVFRGLARFRGDAQFETWLYRIVANAAITQLRRRGRFPELALDRPEGPVEVPGSARVAEQAADRQELTEALASLPLSLRAVVVLKDVYGFPHKEIADLLGTTEGAVKVRLHRARRRLKDQLFASEAGDEV
jgi:RNA polymerase sigma-70 factor (ECF subfamily)